MKKKIWDQLNANFVDLILSSLGPSPTDYIGGPEIIMFGKVKMGNLEWKKYEEEIPS